MRAAPAASCAEAPPGRYHGHSSYNDPRRSSKKLRDLRMKDLPLGRTLVSDLTSGPRPLRTGSRETETRDSPRGKK